LIYERVLETTNRRTFGLFYFSDLTEARVRNVVMRGDWPRTLPSPAELESGDQVAASLDADLPRLQAVFRHDFAKGIPEEYFQVINSDARGGITPRKDGVVAARAGADNWPTACLKLPFSAVGDFDVEVSFQVLKFEADQDAVAMLVANLDDPQQHQCRLLRIRHKRDYQRIEQSLSVLHPTGGRSYSGNPLACEAVAGTLRIARRGATVYYLFAEEESRAFRCVGTHVLNDAPLKQPGIELHSVCHGVGETQVLWKNFSLRAEQLKYVPPDAAPERSLYVMKADGVDLRRLTGPAPGFTHLGSPEWSADGKRIALDMSQGSVDTSHVILVSVEHGELEDIGPGCMPSFSPDGKRIAFSHSGAGVMLMNSDGAHREVIDSTGWGVQWSPDGKYLACGRSANIVVMDARTRQERLLLTGDDASRYSYIYWNLGWSHDSRWIAFKAQNRATREYELAVADIDDPNGFQVLYKTGGSLNADFTWSPDNRRVVFSMHSPPHQGTKLFWVDSAAARGPELFPEQPPLQDILDVAWSPDGRQIAFVGQSPPRPIDWPLELNTK
jgi:Tol biopolymer transport system component